MPELEPLDPIEVAMADLMSMPLDKFTAARDRLAGEAKQNGDDLVAAAVTRLRKPTLGLWALNQLGRTNADGVEMLLGAGTRVRRAQAAALRREAGATAEMRAASEEQRRAEDRLVDSAADVLGRAGRAAPEETMRRLRQALGAVASGDEATRDRLRRGAFLAEPTPAGFDSLASLGLEGGSDGPGLRVLPDPVSRPASGDKSDARARAMARASAATTEQEKALREVAKLGRLLEEASGEAGRLGADSERLAREAEAVGDALARALRLVANVDARLAAAKRRATDLGAAAARATAALRDGPSAQE
ncbi:MAG: hypothetical protein ACYDGR_00155 [Candidatus Dormibacteria bacterium]